MKPFLEKHFSAPTTMLSNAPEELRALQQWVCFDIEDGKKIPYTPGSNNQAASNRPRDWRSFRAACKDVEEGKRQHIGFCFTTSDPYVFIDLDDPDDADQIRIFERFNTYAQRSVSGEGCHLICRGTFQGKGKHPAYPHAGLFKENRFCLFTGDVVAGRSEIKDVPEDDLQAIHSWLGGSSDAEEVPLTEYEAVIPDQTVFEMGCDRFAKFESLCRGDWRKYEEFHNDHSTADHAFIAMLCDLTESNEQVRWLFGVSGMWNEERAEKKAGHGFEGYVNRTISKIRSNQSRDRERASRITLRFEDHDPVPLDEDTEDPQGGCSLIESLPDGLLKDIAKYSFRTSFYPLQEASLCNAITIMSGLCGRGYLTHTKQGLNLWTILVGGTSCGKDEFQAGIGRIFTGLEKRGFKSISKLFGGELVSGPALEQAFADRKRYISYMHEFGDMFKMLANPFAPDHIRTLNRGLLNSYNAAGEHGSIKARRKAQGVEGVESIERPCLVLAGEATPESLYGAIGTRELATGFLQRFMIVNVPQGSWSLRENPDNAKAPPKSLMDKLERLVEYMDSLEVDDRKGKDFKVVEGTEEAIEMLHNYRMEKRREIMHCPDGLARKEVINRAGMKALRLASILAVSADPFVPVITVEHAKWAIMWVDKCDNEMLEKFSSGEVGSGQTKQEAEILKAVKDLSGLTVRQRGKLGMTSKVAKDPSVIPLSVLKNSVVGNSVFSSDRAGAVTAFEKCIDSLTKAGTFSKFEKDYALDNYDHIKGVLLCIH